jgi:dihydroorotate dehydrogenase
MSLSSLGFALARPVLHRLDAETAHRATIKALACAPAPATPKQDSRLAQSLFDLSFPNPLGLAPGFDKNAEVPDAMLALGFGFVEVGTVTPKPQAGNPRPRLFRLPEDEAVINRMGFNNEGADAALRRLQARARNGGILGVNIGANKDAADRMADYEEGIRRFGPLASYITVNISSPNTPGLRALQSRDDLERLLARVSGARAGLGIKVPVFLKIAPDLVEDELADVAKVASGGAVDAVIISNTTISRPASLRSAAASEQGGLSGKPLRGLATRQLARFHGLTGGQLPLIGVGGIHDAASAWERIEAGASLIQLYSALVFQGPALVQEILAGLVQRLASEGLSSLAPVIGRKAAALAKS